MDLFNLLLLFVPPIAGGIIGYFTNDLAIKMLFRPYRPIYIGKRQLPFTPGLIPRNQERLARRVADTIMGSLLTPTELQRLAKRLLHTERVEGAILWLLNLALDQVRSDKQQKTAHILAGILRDLIGESLPRMLKVLARRKDFLEAQLNHVFDQILLEFRLDQEQARKLSEWILKVVLPPDILRQAVIDFLTDRNIQIIDEDFREKSSGTYWVVANLFGIRNALIRLRSFCLDEKEATNARIEELIVALGTRDRLREWLQNVSLQNLPLSTVRQLRKTMRDSVRAYIQEGGAEFIQGLNQSIDWEKVSALIVNRLRDSAIMTTSLTMISKELALVIERYLEEDLEKIMTEVIPILSIDEVIVERVNATSPKDMEITIQTLVKSELQAIVNLGGILGVMVGLFQTVLLLLTGGI
ncbi:MULTISPECIES: DUF445 family protein [Moorena]|uniref:DUF445 domain-containing protein n=1 Tax=Moorena producens 3L TaxID=489825 RepID=F4XTT7_9CYAN|nr:MULTISPECIES: DUF445 family protein [Moorena]EGJ31913.1 hypothetical protein LYNGBM3L_31060 [Moorena producens 3L]NEP31672.1 DUF445 domain-containing protein [Moorena sp. SIO3B2]NEP64329.1 DUF445 domain-containing protein [Moorena sp. SIO3A5]NEQ04473.1 DUF445 domain-containing protein [Moorena sp. SIO4E2]NER89197.1 DUF445 domain-containing protein [Moorena sp. SIO3A2]